MSDRRPALGFIFVTVLLDVLGVGLIIPILPKLVEELQGTGVQGASYTFGILVGLYSLMLFLCAPILGSLSDRVGRRPVILLALLGSGLDYFLLAWAPTLAWLFVGRIISGITGANFAAASAYIADISPPEKRAAHFGVLGAAFGLGFIGGPALGGILGEIGIRVPFIAAGVLTIANWLYGLFVLPESLDRDNRRAFSWKRANPVGAIGALRHKPMIRGLSVVYFISSFAHQVYPATWVLYTSFRYGWTPRETGLSLALVGFMAALVQGWLTRVVVPRTGERNAAVFGLCTMVVAMVGYGLASAGWMVYVIIFFGSFSGIATPALQGVVSQEADDDEQGRVQGAISSLQSMAGFAGPPVETGLFGYFIGSSAPLLLPGAAFFFSALLTILAAVLTIRTFHRHRPSRFHEGGRI